MSNSQTTQRAKARRVERWSLFIVGGVLVLSSLVVVVFEGVQFMRALGSTSWSTVEGAIVDCRIEESRVHFKYQGMRTVYDVHVEYQYEVGGEIYDGDRVAFDKQMGSTHRDQAESIAAAYPAGQAVTVYYSPDDPRLAVLEPGAEGGSWAMLAGAVMSLLVGVAMLVVGQVLSAPRVSKPDPFNEPVQPSKKAAGLWQDDGSLVVDPAGAVFPMRCLWTNEPVHELMPPKWRD